MICFPDEVESPVFLPSIVFKNQDAGLIDSAPSFLLHLWTLFATTFFMTILGSCQMTLPFSMAKWPCSSLFTLKVEAPQFEHISPYLHPCWQFDAQTPTPFTTGMTGGDTNAVPSMSLPPFPTFFLMCPTRPTFFPFSIFDPLYFHCGIVTQWLCVVFLIFQWPPADTDNNPIF